MLLGCHTKDRMPATEARATKTSPSQNDTEQVDIDNEKAASPQKPSGFFLEDSLSIIDSLIEREAFNDSTAHLQSDSLEKNIYGMVRGNKKTDTVLYTEGCTGEDIHYRIYANGIQEISSGDVANTFLFEGDALKPFGLAKGDSTSILFEKYGKPRKVNQGTALYVSEPIDKSEKHYFDYKWKIYFVLVKGRVRKLIFEQLFDDC